MTLLLIVLIPALTLPDICSDREQIEQTLCVAVTPFCNGNKPLWYGGILVQHGLVSPGSSVSDTQYQSAMDMLMELCDPPLPGDLNGDGQVGVQDLLILLSGWGNCSADELCVADLNGDGAVGVVDLLILLSNWGQT